MKDAFISRIHVQLFYPDFTDDERQQVWMTFVQKLTKERGKFMRISMDAKDYIRGNEVRSVKWNGREIRNGEPEQTHCGMMDHDLMKSTSFSNCRLSCGVRG